MVADISRSRALLTTHSVAKLLKSKEAGSVVDSKSWPIVIEVDDAPKRKLSNPYRAPTPEMIAYIDFSVSTTGSLSGVKVASLFVLFIFWGLKTWSEGDSWTLIRSHIARELDELDSK